MRLVLDKVEKIDSWLAVFAIALLSPLSLIFWLKPDKNDLLTYLSFVISVWAAMYGGRGVFKIVSKRHDDLVARTCTCTCACALDHHDITAVENESGSAEVGGAPSSPTLSPSITSGRGDGHKRCGCVALGGNGADAEQDSFAQHCFFVSLMFLASAALLLIPTVFKDQPIVFAICLIVMMVLFTVGLWAAAIIALRHDKSHPYLRVAFMLVLTCVNVVEIYLLVKFH